MEQNIIRKLTIKNSIPFVGEDRKLTGQLMPLNLVLGVEHTIYLEGEKNPVKRKICDIIATETHYLIYLENDTEKQLWKKLPKTKDCEEEYKID